MKRTSIIVTLFFLLSSLSVMAQNTLRMNSNQRLDKGQKIEVAGKGKLILQTDGNLVAYDAANQPKWASSTYGSAVTHVIMQTDGNLVIYNNSTPVWASNTWNQANNGYFEIDLNTWRVTIFRQDGTVAKELQGAIIAVLSDPTNITMTSTSGTPALKFPRQDTWEVLMLKALGVTGVTATTYAGLTDFQKALGEMVLLAAELYYPVNNQPNISPTQAYQNLNQPMIDHPVKSALNGLIISQISKKLSLNQNDAQSVALRNWAVPVYREFKVNAAIGSLKEFQKWKANPCAYSAPGYSVPIECSAMGKNAYFSMWTSLKPPTDIFLKAGIVYASGQNEAIAASVAAGVAAVGSVAGFLGVGITGTSLNLAFGGTSALAAAGIAGTSVAGWASVTAGPIAIISMAITIGVLQGVAVIEGEQAEWKFKQSINAALNENINMANVLAEDKQAAGFFISAVKSALNGWQAPNLDIEGELTLMNEGGYVGKFYVNYMLNGQSVAKSTANLGAGNWQNIALPKGARDISVRGVMIAAGEVNVFTQQLSQPAYKSYKMYGTVFSPTYNNDWPMSVSGEYSANAYEVKLTHGAGFVANFQVDYNEPGKTAKTVKNWNGKSLGWKETVNLPSNATNVRIFIQGNTGLAWEPWRTTYDKTFPTPPNACIKIYGTTLSQNWNSDCK